MEARRKVASIEEFIISLQAEVIEEAAVAEEVVAPVEQPVEYVAPIVEESAEAEG